MPYPRRTHCECGHPLVAETCEPCDAIEALNARAQAQRERRRREAIDDRTVGIGLRQVRRGAARLDPREAERQAAQSARSRRGVAGRTR